MPRPRKTEEEPVLKLKKVDRRLPAREQAYQVLRAAIISTEIPPGTMISENKICAAIGVIGAGAAPIAVLHTLMNALPRDGKLVFSFNDHALQDPSNEGGVAEWTDCGAARLLFRESGDHLPGIGLNSNVYILEKA